MVLLIVIATGHGSEGSGSIGDALVPSSHHWHCQCVHSRPVTSHRHDLPDEVTPELEAEISRGYELRDRSNMAPTIAYFEALLARHPGHPVLIYEVAGAYDTAGLEADARLRYEEALQSGLSGDNLRRCLCQYASTLRWLGEHGQSLDVLDRGRREFPRSDSIRVFRSLTLNDMGRHDEAIAELLTVVTEHGDVTDLGRYATGLAGLAQWLADGRPE